MINELVELLQYSRNAIKTIFIILVVQLCERCDALITLEVTNKTTYTWYLQSPINPLLSS